MNRDDAATPLNPRSDAERVGRPAFLGPNTRCLRARPENLHFEPQRTALMVVDMQNAYLSEGGYMHAAGFDIGHAQATIEQTSRVIEAARAAGVTVVYLQNGWDARYVEAGGPGVPNWHKSNALKTMRQRAELDGTLLAKGSWDYEIVDAVRPQPGDLVVAKTRYSGFFNTPLDSLLRSRDIRTLAFCGVATNVCVESTLRDAYHLEYFCALLADASTHAGPDETYRATLFNIETFFGWVSHAAAFLEALSAKAPKTA